MLNKKHLGKEKKRLYEWVNEECCSVLRAQECRVLISGIEIYPCEHAVSSMISLFAKKQRRWFDVIIK